VTAMKLYQRVELRHDEAVVVARQRAGDLAELLGFDRRDQTRIATATSELARNAYRYARGGRVLLARDDEALRIEVSDDGPGIPHLDDVLSGRHRSSTGMGHGLVGVHRLMDDVRIDTSAEVGTRVVIRKAIPPHMAPDDRAIGDELARRSAASPYDEVSRQNEELLVALGEVRARTEELRDLNRELESTNRGVVALYAELDDRAEQLRDADQRKSRFLADMSHELRTPLNSIVALTELLLDGEPALAAEQAKQVAYIRRMADEQLRLVSDLLDMAKIEAGRVDVNLTDVSIAELFALVRAQLRPLVHEEAVALRFVAEPDLPPLHTDEALLVQVLRNLVSNAIKFTPEGEIVVRAERQGEAVRLSVSDTGIGISAPDLDRIFDEFVQIPSALQRHGKGTGLGLALVIRLVGLLGGRVSATSTVGEGSTFEVSLPAHRDAVLPAEVPDPSGAILVVDDDEAARYVVRAHLGGAGWEVAEVASGSAALAACERGLPLAIVLDLSMPDLDGTVVLTRLRAEERTRAVPVVVHTSRLMADDVRRQVEAQGARVLDKSKTSQVTLRAAITDAIRRTDGR
jgi:signal transduction histidine kinase/CheY-like chemotaxis protein